VRGAIKSRVDDNFGLPGVTIELRSPALREPRVMVSNGHVEFSTNELPPGRHAVTLHLEGWTAAPYDVDLESGETAALDLRIEPRDVVPCGLTSP
jgi:hypothetical protein